MRAIRFRQWINSGKRYHYFSFKDGICEGVASASLDSCPIYQFTGLLDKNGKEVYEGDIVFSDSWNPEYQEVTFDRGGFCLKYKDAGYYADIKYAEQMEVVGNIHENPDLLK